MLPQVESVPLVVWVEGGAGTRNPQLQCLWAIPGGRGGGRGGGEGVGGRGVENELSSRRRTFTTTTNPHLLPSFSWP